MLTIFATMRDADDIKEVYDQLMICRSQVFLKVFVGHYLEKGTIFL